MTASSVPRSALVHAQQFFSSRSSLPSKSNYLWQIQQGFVRTLTWLEDGNVVALGVWGAGDIVGRSLSQTTPYQVECLTEVCVIPVPMSNLPNFGEILLAQMQQAEELMKIRSYRRVDMMLLKLLGWLAKRFGHEVKEGYLIDLRLTHQDLSELLGITRVTVTRTLSQLEQQGLIQRQSLQRIILQEEEIWHYEI